MAYTMEQYLEEERQRMLEEKQAILNSLTPEERLQGLDAETVIKHYDPEERLQGLTPKERLQGLDAETVIKHYDPEERLQGLTQEEIEAYLQKMKQH